MSGFDLISRLFGLVLGLAVVEVVKGFARIWRIRHRLDGAQDAEIRIGWMVPLLGMLALADQTTFWFNFSEFGPHLPANHFGLLAMMVVIGAYYALSTFIFPQDPEAWPDFDDYYMRIRRPVIGGMLAINMVVMIYGVGLIVAEVGIEAGADQPLSETAELLAVLALVTLLFTRSKRANLILLAAATALSLVAGVPA